ncbi:MAG: hypothetical protein ACFFEF_15430 [Candidatus Thorarchaeota archaeon]
MTQEKNNTHYEPKGSPYTIEQYAVISFIFTPITAWLLSFYGFIPFEPLHAAIMGFGVAIVYVGYRWYYSKIYRKDEREALKAKLDA